VAKQINSSNQNDEVVCAVPQAIPAGPAISVDKVLVKKPPETVRRIEIAVLSPAD
jgi:hypothetical protein